MERVNKYFKDRTKNFDVYYSFSTKDNECNLDHVYNWIDLFVSLYNNTIVEKNKISIQIEEAITIKLRQPFSIFKMKIILIN